MESISESRGGSGDQPAPHRVAEGRTNKEIAIVLGLSDQTVKNYLSNAMDKLNTSRRVQAAALYG